MSDITLFKPARHERTRQYRAGRELTAYLRERLRVGNLDCTIEPETRVTILDMKKSWLIHDVVKFNFVRWSYRNLRANDA